MTLITSKFISFLHFSDLQPLSKPSLNPRTRALLSHKSDQVTSPWPPEASHVSLSRAQRRTEPVLPSCPPASSITSCPPAHTILAVLPDNSHSSTTQGHSPHCIPCLKWDSHGWLAHSLNYSKSVIKCHLFSTSFTLSPPSLISLSPLPVIVLNIIIIFVSLHQLLVLFLIFFHWNISPLNTGIFVCLIHCHLPSS